ncbi:MAG: METTL5 family protein [Candidatus Bathyarchaeia archaeon]|nr:50S ribosomal protein L11 methyltransferase [Candidatus Bathyarchaeota archaeon]
MIKKKHLSILLSKLSPSPSPKLKWEGYTLDPESASEMIHVASWINNDIKGKTVIDLGCGSGILAIGAALAGAKDVYGVDIDKEAVKAAKKNAEKTGVRTELIAGDIDCVRGCFDTTLMNPPFGTRKRGADILFLRKALEISDVVYSLHKKGSSTSEFLRQKIPEIGGKIDQVREMEIAIRRTYSFHRKRNYKVKVNLYRIIKMG